MLIELLYSILYYITGSGGSARSQGRPLRPSLPVSFILHSEKGEVHLRGVDTLRYGLILSESSACQVTICAVAAS